MMPLQRTPLAALIAGLFTVGVANTAWAQEQQAVLLAVATPPPAAPEPVQTPLGGQVTTLAVQVNGQNMGSSPVLEKNGLLFVPVQNLKAWRVVQRTEVVALHDAGQIWYPLTAIRGVELQLNTARTSLILTVPPPSLLADNAPYTNGSPNTPPGAQQVIPMTTGAAVTGERFLPIEVLVNGENMGNWVLLEKQSTLYAPETAFAQWRMARPPDAPSIEVRGQKWVALSSFRGFQVALNSATQTVSLTFAPEVFAATRISDAPPPPPPITPAIPMGFVNYDFSYNTQSSKTAGNSYELGSTLEFGLSGNLGVLTSSYVGRGLTSSDSTVNASWRRLETTFTKDLPEHGLTLRLGDSTTRYGLMGQSLYFGGVQIGTNFGLRPGFISQPLPVLAGTSVAPSTVDLYINDALRKTGSVPTGPFTLENMSSITGSGQARVVVRDVLGRETVITQDFFTSNQLLKQGLSDWSVELGKLRRNLGTLNADYGDPFSSGMVRYGVSDQSTLEGNTQISRQVKVLGLGLTQALPWQMLGQFGLSASQAETVGMGHQYLLGVEQHGRQHGYALRLQGFSRDYRRLGVDVSADQDNKRQISASYSYNSKNWGSAGVGYARTESYTTAPLNTFTASYSTTVGQRSSLMFNLTRVTGASSGTAVAVSLVIPLDGGLISTSSASHASGGGTVAYTSLAKPLSEEIGWGWRTLLGTQTGGSTFGEAGVMYQGSKALFTADAAASSQTQALRLGARGGLAVADGHVVLSRRVENAMALVEVPGFADVGIGLQGGGDLTRTDASGIALLPRLIPYYNNQIQLNAKDLPISAEIDNTEMSVVPANRTTVKVAFPVRSGRAALIKLVLDDGQPAPAGAELELIGDKREFFVARRGEAFVTAMQNTGELRLKHKGQSCTVKVELPPQKDDDIARVGPLTCSGVKR